MLLLKVHKGHLIRSYVHMAIQNIRENISVPYIIVPFRILYYFRSVKYTYFIAVLFYYLLVLQYKLVEDFVQCS